MTKITAKFILDAEQREIADRETRFTGLRPSDKDFHDLMPCMIEDCIEQNNQECEQALIETWRPGVSLQSWFIEAKRFAKGQIRA